MITKGSSINDVTVLGGGGGCQGCCDNSTKALVVKRVTMGRGGGSKNVQNLSDVIYGRPDKHNYIDCYVLAFLCLSEIINTCGIQREVYLKKALIFIRFLNFHRSKIIVVLCH